MKDFGEDELCQFIFTVGAYREFFRLILTDSKMEKAARVRTDAPILLISGAKDPIGMNGRGVLAVSDLLVEAGIEPEVFLYPADRHEILNEEDKEFFEVLTGYTDGDNITCEFDKNGNVVVYGSEHNYYTCYDYDYPVADIYKELVTKMSEQIEQCMISVKEQYVENKDYSFCYIIKGVGVNQKNGSKNFLIFFVIFALFNGCTNTID